MLGTGTDITGMDIVPKVPNFLVPVRTSYRTYRTSRYRYGLSYRHHRYRYEFRTERTELLCMVRKPIPVPVPMIPAVCPRIVYHIARPNSQLQNARGKIKMFVCVRATIKPLTGTKQKYILILIILTLYGVNPRLSLLKFEHRIDQQIPIQTKTTTDFNFQGSVRKFKIRIFESLFQATNCPVAKSKKERPTNPKTSNYS